MIPLIPGLAQLPTSIARSLLLVLPSAVMEVFMPFRIPALSHSGLLIHIRYFMSFPLLLLILLYVILLLLPRMLFLLFLFLTTTISSHVVEN